jgi:hypothetical protein
MFADVRRKIGGKTKNEVADAVLDDYLNGALEWLAAQLHYRIETDTTTLLLVEDQQEYDVPTGLIEVIFLEWDDTRLAPSSVYAWDRTGTTWRGAASGAPREFAVQGRKIVLNPPPDSDSIDTEDTLVLRGVFLPASINALTAGPTQVAPLDGRLVCWKAAQQWLKVNASQENYARAQAYQSEIDPLLKAARKNAQAMIRDYRPRWRWRSYRQGAAR